MDLSGYEKDDLLEEYNRLSTSYVQLKKSEDDYRQQIHELKRSYQVAVNAEAFLSNELETISSMHKRELDEITSKLHSELEDGKLRCTAVLEANIALESEVEDLKRSVEKIRKELSDKNIELANNATKTPVTSQTDIQRIAWLEQERVELDGNVNKLRQQLNTALKGNIHLERQIEDLKESLECSEATLHTKRNELEEKNELFEVTQDRVFQLTSELSTLRNGPDVESAKRGNSLFAEVDDQRKKMRDILSAQKVRYDQMKKAYNTSQQEIRSIERQTASMQKELEICSSMFMNADHNYKISLNERINKLMIENGKLEEKLRWTEAKLIATADEKGISWLDSMFTYCRNETAQYKDELHSCRLKMANTEETLRNMQDEMARWRFEALKLRYLILNREALLEANGVAFETDVPNITQHINKMNPASHKPNVFIDLKKIHHLVPSSSTAPQTPDAKLDQKSENKENNCDRRVKKENILTSQNTKHEKTQFKSLKSPRVIKKLPIMNPKSVEPLNGLENLIQVPLNSVKTAASKPAAPHRTTPVPVHFVPQYRTITHTPEGMSTLARNIAQLKIKQTPAKSIPRDLFPILDTKKVVNFSHSTVGEDDPKATEVAKSINNEAAKPNISAEEVSRKPLSEFVVKRIFVKSKIPKSDGNF